MNNKPWLYIALLFSLMLNSFMVGMAMAPHWHHGHDMIAQDRHPTLSRMEKATVMLDPASRGQVEEILHQQQDKAQAAFHEMDALFKQMRAITTAPTFDAAKLNAVHHSIEATDKKLKDSFSAVIAQIAQTLPDSERVEFFSAALPDHMPSPGDAPPADMPLSHQPGLKKGPPPSDN